MIKTSNRSRINLKFILFRLKFIEQMMLTIKRFIKIYKYNSI